MGKTLSDESHKEVKESFEFPAGIPRPHAYAEWLRQLETSATKLDLIDISLERVPEGKFDLVYSDASLEMPPRPGDRASYGDKLAYRKYVDEIEKRRRHNAKVKQERNAWFLNTSRATTSTLSSSRSR